MKYLPKIIATLILLSLLLRFPLATFQIRPPRHMEVGLMKSMTEAGLVTEDNAAEHIKEFRALYKKELSTSKKAQSYAASVVWWLLLVGSVCIISSKKRWGFYLIYAATALNLYASFSYLPLVADMLGNMPLLKPLPLILIQLINLSMVALLVVAQRKSAHNSPAPEPDQPK